jgi:translation initiation factor 3 subunit D
MQNMVQYSPSVDIRPEWSVLEQLQVPVLAKMQLQVGPPEDLKKCGTLAFYDRTVDRVTPKNLLPLAKTQCVFRSVTASEDPVLQSIASESKARVFITDSVLTALMCAPRSVYSWDIVISRKGNQLWFDKRPDSVLDQQTVNESAADGVPEDESINGVHQLAIEATAILQNFSQQYLDRVQTEEFGDPNPFATVRRPIRLICIGCHSRSYLQLRRNLEFVNRLPLCNAMHYRHACVCRKRQRTTCLWSGIGTVCGIWEGT